jgi:hypothetical protein
LGFFERKYLIISAVDKHGWYLELFCSALVIEEAGPPLDHSSRYLLDFVVNGHKRAD